MSGMVPMPRREPVIAHDRPDSIIAWRQDGPVTAARFLADVARLAGRMPSSGNVLNVCQDRYRFMVGFVAALVAGKVSLLPSSNTPEAIRRLKDFAPDVFCLHDGEGEKIDLPRLEFRDEPVPEAASGLAPFVIPEVDIDRVGAVMLTSGSTGTPVPHTRTWGSLLHDGRAEAERLGLIARGHAIVGTVPAQHAYGLESTVLLSMLGNCAAWAGRPFYPADIAAALAAVPRPRLLVTTPFHLRALLDSGVDVPPADMILCATAPLSLALAGEAEARLGAPLFEIYGCTETGQLATRRTIEGQGWRPYPGIRIEVEEGGAFASGGHVAGRQLLTDQLEVAEDGSFLLHGRDADMVNIAGKRSSIGYLNHQLLAIAGVKDGSFFNPDEDTPDGVARLAAFVVAPTLTPRRLLDALRERVDPVFLPRPLIFLERLPRNATGKLPRAELRALLDGQTKGGA